jgi:hypothetical protein
MLKAPAATTPASTAAKIAAKIATKAAPTPSSPAPNSRQA